MQKDEKVEAYLARLEPARQEMLGELRDLVAATVPDVLEGFQYGMPTYERPAGKVVCAFASQKNYISFYMDPDLVVKHKVELGSADCGKSCIRFKGKKDAPLRGLRLMLEEAAV